MRSAFEGIRARIPALRYGFLAIPGVLLAGAVGLAFVLLAVDRRVQTRSFGLAEDANAARSVLEVIASSLITVAGVTFSITVVTLQLVSQQFSPRALRNFLGDRLTQSVIGAFVGLFVFCLLVLRTVRDSAGGQDYFIPELSILAALVLAVGALVLLVVFIDHMSSNIQVSSINAAIARSTLSALDDMYPEPFGEPEDEAEAERLVAEWERERDPEEIFPERPGYVQSINLDDIPRTIGSPGLRLHVPVAPGDFVSTLQPLARVWPGEGGGDVERALRRAIVVGSERDVNQDVGYGIRQLADIAARAVSPGINDPTTAITSARYIRAILERLACRALPDPVRRYEDGAVAVTARRTFADHVGSGFVQLSRYAKDPRVAGALLESIRHVAEVAVRAGARDRIDVLRDAADHQLAIAEAADLVPADLEDLRAAHRRVLDVCAAAGG